jgi:formamidopyrimidine-DNA glycosylase
VPELPEVEHARQQLLHWLRGRKLLEVTARPGSPLRRTTPKQLAALRGRTLRRVDRTGKHLALSFDGDRGLYLHLGMTGKLVRRAPDAESPRFSKVCFRIEGAEVHFCDSRRFGRVRLLKGSELRALPEIAALGPDAWNAPPRVGELRALLVKVRRPIKVALLDQTLLAGLGNLHAVEALWRAKLSPFARADRLTTAQVGALHKAIHTTLAFGLAKMEAIRGDTTYVEEGAANPFFVYDREGKPCRRKGSRRLSGRPTIARSASASRSNAAS